jgi:hypothetical protein
LSVNYSRSDESEESDYQRYAAYPSHNEGRPSTALCFRKSGPKTHYCAASCADQETCRTYKNRNKKAARVQNLEHLAQYNNLVAEPPKSIKCVMQDYETNKARR